MTNGPSKTDKVQCPTRCCVTRESYHWEKWKELSILLRETFFIKLDGTHTVPPCIYNSYITINAMRDLCDEMLNQHGFDSINLRWLHQDVLENFFSLLRRALGSNDNPTAIETIRVIKCLILSKFSSAASNNSNCQKVANEEIPVLHFPEYDSDCEDIVNFICSTDDFMPRMIAREVTKHFQLSYCEQCPSCFIDTYDGENS